MEDQVAEVINIGGQNDGNDQLQVKTFLTPGPVKLSVSRKQSKESTSLVCKTRELTNEVYVTARRLRSASISMVTASLRPKQFLGPDKSALVLRRKHGLQTSTTSRP